MAKKITEILVDDLDGTEITEGGDTVRFGLDGTDYEIDLSAEHAARLRDALAPYVDAGRAVPRRDSARRSARSSGASSTSQGGDRAAHVARNRAVSDWAIAQGLRKPGQRGRISREIHEKYDAAH